MKGLISIPSESDLERAYQRLQFGDVGLADLVNYSQWTRFDPRLAELWVATVSKRWSSIHPIELRTKAAEQPWPGTVAVLLEFCVFLVDKSERELFEKWASVVTHQLKKGENEQFFLGLRQFGGPNMFEDAALSFEEYRKWGYLSKESLINKSTRGSLSSNVRKEILKNLLAQSSRVRTTDYWLAVEKSISRRQAERDLKACKALRASGRTKGRRFAAR